MSGINVKLFEISIILIISKILTDSHRDAPLPRGDRVFREVPR